MRVGLTGGIAAGKSAVARHLQALGAHLVDADRVARDLTSEPGPLVDRLAELAGSEIVEAGGGLDRAALAKRIFGDVVLRRAVEAVLHPAIRSEVDRRCRGVEAADPAAVIVIEAALLVESGRRLATDVLVVVEAPLAAKLERQARRDHRPALDARARLDAQASIGTKVLAADLVVWNDGTESELEDRSAELWPVLVRRATKGNPS